MAVEKINEIRVKAEDWAKNQSTEKLEKTVQNLRKIHGYGSFDEEMQINHSIKVFENELSQRTQEEIVKTKKEILSLFK
jgi:hypothetical protein